MLEELAKATIDTIEVMGYLAFILGVVYVVFSLAKWKLS